jgi:hypothetical protein
MLDTFFIFVSVIRFIESESGSETGFGIFVESRYADHRFKPQIRILDPDPDSFFFHYKTYKIFTVEK